ncbi:MAG: hypothetical protein B7Z63_05235, partial [Ignavibacteriae bacterium 37-53-5]
MVDRSEIRLAQRFLVLFPQLRERACRDKEPVRRQAQERNRRTGIRSQPGRPHHPRGSRGDAFAQRLHE